MRKPKPLDAAHLSRFFIYDESSPSCLRWNRAVSNKVKAGFIAGYKLDSGYWKVSLDGEIYYVHRIIALLRGMFNSVTSDAVDHINGNRSDNRIANLRVVTHSENQQNRKRINGCTWKDNRWQAQIGVGGRTIYIGRFHKKEDAVAAYFEAKSKLHPSSPVK